MKNEIWYDHFIQLLYDKYPKKSQLIQALQELLFIEREAAYRRLSKNVAFSIHEIVKIASTWNLSLDKITGIYSGQVPFQMQQMNYLDPSDEELILLQRVIQGINYLKDSPDAEFMDICNKLPRKLLAGFDYLHQFYFFKWKYQYGGENETVSFAQTVISEKKRQVTTDYYQAIKQVPNTNFIWDRMIFDYLVNDIRYFCSIYLITNEEKELIKKDLYALLDYLMEIANKGCYPETQNKVNIYVSQLNVDTNYSYVFTPEANICFVHVFEKYEIHSFDPEMVANFKSWMQLKKRTSTQISEVDEKSRIQFFTRQRQLVDGL